MPKKGNVSRKSKKSVPGHKAGKNPRPSRPRRSGGSGNPAAMMSSCSQDYAQSLANPFGSAAACLPQGFPLPSQKLKVMAKGTASQGTSLGYVLLNPYTFVSNNVYGCLYTISTYAGSTVDKTAATAGVSESYSNSPYSSSQFAMDTGKSYRVVSAGVRVKYRGTADARCGRFVCFEHPGHGQVHGLSIDQVLAFDNITSTGVPEGDQWVSVLWTGPKMATDLVYDDTTSDSPDYRACLAILWDGGSAGTFSVEWEAVVNYEIVGTGVPTTPSHHDPTGASAVANAISHAQGHHGNASHEDFMQSASTAIKHYAGEALSGAARSVGSYVKDHGWEIAGDAAKLALTFL